MLYKYLDLSLPLFIVALQTEPDMNISTGYIELIIGFIIGFSPILFNAIKDRTRWKTERTVVQSEAVENIANAASILAESSQDLAEKSAALISLYDNALQRQVKMTEQEREKRRIQEIEHSVEINELKHQIEEINETVLFCSTEILGLITDINEGNEITPERLQALESYWNRK